MYVYAYIDDKDQKRSQKVLVELENIDDDCDQNDIAFVKIDDDKEAEEWGIDEIPTIVNSIDHFCHGISNQNWILKMFVVLCCRYSLNAVFHTSMKVI